MRSNDDATADQDTPAPSTLPQPDPPSQPESQSSSPPSESASVSSPSDSASTTSPQKSATPSLKPGGSCATEAKVSRMILGSVGKDEPEWKWVQHSQYGVINRGGPKFIKPDNAQSCELSAASTDPHALVYSIPVMPNTYDVLQDDGFNLSLPPEVDIEAAMIDEDGMKTIVSGFSAGSDLVPHEADARQLKDVRKIPSKVEQLSVEELQQAIDAFLVTEVLAFTSHEDVVAAVQAQPAYFRRIFKLPTEKQDRLLKAHAIYRMVNAEPLADDESTDVMERVRCRCDVDPVDTDAVFAHLFQDEQRQQAAIHSAISGLFLMIFAPGLYIGPVKVQALLPPAQTATILAVPAVERPQLAPPGSH